MKPDEKLEITDPLIRYLTLILIGVPFVFTGYFTRELGIVGWFFLVTGLISLATGLYGLFSPKPSITFSADKVKIIFSNKSFYEVPWNEVKALGYKWQNSKIGSLAINIGTDYLALILKDSSKYPFKLNSFDKKIFYAYEDFASEIGHEFKGGLFLRLDAIGEKKADQIIKFISKLDPKILT